MLITTSKTGGCIDTLTQDYLFRGLYVPTAFAPQSTENNDSESRIFQPKGKGLKSYRIEVYDKWGNLLWFSEELQNGMGVVGTGDDHTHPGPGWNGKYKGEYVPLGAYAWKIQAQFLDGTVWDGKNVGDGKK